jgi:hypothetical protein
MGNPVPAITEAVQENLASWAPDSALDFASLVESLPGLLEALRDGLVRAIASADPGEALSHTVSGDLEAVLKALVTAHGAAVDAGQSFRDAYGFWLGRD